MALARRLAALLVVAAGGLLGPVSGSVAAPADAAFSVAGVAVDVTAADAAMARTEALAAGQREAFRRLLERLVLAVDFGRLPAPPDPVITELVQSFEVADERVGPDRYIAALTFHFNPGGVGRLLRDRGIPYAATASEPVVVIPLYDDADGLLLWEDGNPWRAAWAGLPPSNSLVPLIVPFGELADLGIISAEQAKAGDRVRIARLAERYGAGEAIVIDAVVANDPSRGAPQVSVTMRRFQPEGVRVGGGAYSGLAWETLDAVLAAAAEATRAQIENEWKEANLLRFDREGRIVVDVPLSGLAEWLDIRNRLAGLALVRELDITALSPRFARLVLHYLGDERQLAGALARGGLRLEREADLWIIRRQGDESRAGAGEALAPGAEGPDPIVIE